MELPLDMLIKLTTIIGSVFAATLAVNRYIYGPIIKKVRYNFSRLDAVSALTESVQTMATQTAIIPELLEKIGSIRTTQIRIEQRQVIEAQITQCVLDSDSKSYFQANLAGELDMVSTAFCKLVGRTESELLGNNWLNCVDHQSRNEVMNQLQLARRENRMFKYPVDFISGNKKVIKTVMHTYPIPRNVPVMEVMLYFGVIEKIHE